VQRRTNSKSSALYEVVILALLCLTLLGGIYVVFFSMVGEKNLSKQLRDGY
jgi:hypothetical protein